MNLGIFSKSERLSQVFLCCLFGSLVTSVSANASDEPLLKEIPTPVFAASSGSISSGFLRDTPHFSIPTLEPFKLTNQRTIPPSVTLKGFASYSVGTPDPDQLIDRLVETTMQRDRERDLLDARARYHDKVWRKMWVRSRDMVQYATSYQGFETSSEAADVILEEKLKLKSKNAVELVRQKRADSAHLQLTYAIMQLATGLGLTDETKKQQTIERGMQAMIPLVGEDEAARSVELLYTWSKQISVPEDAFSADPWDPLTVKDKLNEVVTASVPEDEVVKSVKTRLHRYNHLSNLNRVSSKVINTSLSLAALTPTFVSPAAQGLQFAYIAATGGPEEKKCLKEVYLDRCYETRLDRLNEETMLMVTSHNSAVAMHNPVLLSCTEALMQSYMNPPPAPPVAQSTAATTHHKMFGMRHAKKPPSA
jgi:hypothetical protein